MSGWHAFGYVRGDGESFFLGDWCPQGRRPPTAVMHITRNRGEAERWRESLRRGELPDAEAPPPDGPLAPPFA